MTWDDFYKQKKSQIPQTTWDEFYQTYSQKPTYYTTESLYNPYSKQKKKYTSSDFKPLNIKWQYDWSQYGNYDETDEEEQLRKMRNVPPRSVLQTYDFENKEDVKRFKAGLPSLNIEKFTLSKKAKEETELYKKEREKRLKAAIERAEQNKGFFKKLFNKKTTAADIDFEEPELPSLLQAWQGYQNKLEEYQNKIENMDESDLEYLKLIGKMPKEPEKPLFELPDTWENIVKDKETLFDEYMRKKNEEERRAQEIRNSMANGNQSNKLNNKTKPINKDNWLSRLKMIGIDNTNNSDNDNIPKSKQDHKEVLQNMLDKYKQQTQAPSDPIEELKTLYPDKTQWSYVLGVEPYRVANTVTAIQKSNIDKNKFAKWFKDKAGSPIDENTKSRQMVYNTNPQTGQELGAINSPYSYGKQRSADDIRAKNKEIISNIIEKYRDSNMHKFLNRIGTTAANIISGGNVSQTQRADISKQKINQLSQQYKSATSDYEKAKIMQEINQEKNNFKNIESDYTSDINALNHIGDIVGSLIGISTPIPGTSFSKMGAFSEAGKTSANLAKTYGTKTIYDINRTTKLGSAYVKGAESMLTNPLLKAAATALESKAGQSAINYAGTFVPMTIFDDMTQGKDIKEITKDAGASVITSLAVGAARPMVQAGIYQGTSKALNNIMEKYVSKVVDRNTQEGNALFEKMAVAGYNTNQVINSFGGSAVPFALFELAKQPFVPEEERKNITQIAKDATVIGLFNLANDVLTGNITFQKYEEELNKYEKALPEEVYSTALEESVQDFINSNEATVLKEMAQKFASKGDTKNLDKFQTRWNYYKPKLEAIINAKQANPELKNIASQFYNDMELAFQGQYVPPAPKTEQKQEDVKLIGTSNKQDAPKSSKESHDGVYNNQLINSLDDKQKATSAPITGPENIPQNKGMDVTNKIDTMDQTVDNTQQDNAVIAATDNMQHDNNASAMAEESDTNDADNTTIKQLDPQTIKVDPARFQFKQDVDKNTGASKTLDIAKWDKHLAGTVLVWEDKKGNNWIVNGHHRLQKAKELGINHINAMIIRERDGYSDQDARELGAKINIAEGHGTITDAAKLFRDGNYTIERIKEEGLPLNSGNAQKGLALSQLNDFLFSRVTSKELTEEKGAIIGGILPSDNGGINDAKQNHLWHQIKDKSISADVVKEMAEMLKTTDANPTKQQTLFGEELVWNSADFEIKPKLVSDIKKLIISNKNAFSKAIKNSTALQNAGNVLADEANKKHKDVLEQVLEFLDNGKYIKGNPINEILDKYVEMIKADMPRSHAAEKASKDIISLVSSGKYLEMVMPNQNKTAQPIKKNEQINLFGGKNNGEQSTDKENNTVVHETTEQPEHNNKVEQPEHNNKVEQPEQSAPGTETRPEQELTEELKSDEALSTKKPTVDHSQQTTHSLDEFGIEVTQNTTKRGNTVYEISNVDNDDKEIVAAIKKMGGRWYAPKKVWSFYTEENPSDKLLDRILKEKGIVEKSYNNTVETLMDDIIDIFKTIDKNHTYDEYSRVVETKINDLDMPEMHGTPKQTKWANTIRKNVISKMLLESCMKFSNLPVAKDDYTAKATSDVKKMQAERINEMLEYTDASFWINNRGNFFSHKIKYNDSPEDINEYDIAYELLSMINGRKSELKKEQPQKATSKSNKQPTTQTQQENNVQQPTSTTLESKAAQTAYDYREEIQEVIGNAETVDTLIQSLEQKAPNDWSSTKIKQQAVKNIIKLVVDDDNTTNKVLDILKGNVQSSQKAENTIDPPSTNTIQFTSQDNDIISQLVNDKGIKQRFNSNDKQNTILSLKRSIKDAITDYAVKYMDEGEMPKDIADWYDSSIENSAKIDEMANTVYDMLNNLENANTMLEQSKNKEDNKNDHGKANGTLPTRQSGANGHTGILGVDDTGKHKAVQPEVSNEKPEQTMVQDVDSKPPKRSSSSKETNGRLPDDRTTANAESGGNVGQGSSILDTGRTTTRPTGRNVTDTEGSTDDKQKSTENTYEQKPQNYRIKDSTDVFVKGGKKTRYKANIRALNTLIDILKESRSATPTEQQILAQYSGWGSLPEVFDYVPGKPDEAGKKDWAKEFKEMRQKSNELADVLNLSAREVYYKLRSSTQNAFYTHPEIINGMYYILQHIGAPNGTILEPAMGIGNFFGLLPDKYLRSKLYGVELDPIAGNIAKLLYPEANIQITGFQKTRFPNNMFDVVIGNVPFGDVPIYDNEIKNTKLRSKIHNYFFVKSINKVKPGGFVLFITSTGTLDSQDSQEVRDYLANRANLVGAIRLPNNVFKENAGTSVTTDIIVLQKLQEGEIPTDIDWANISPYTIDGKKYNLNNYYIKHPEMMLGNIVVDGLYGAQNRLALEANSEDITAQLANVVEEYFPKNIASPMIKHYTQDINLTSEELGVKPGTVMEKNGAIVIKTDNGVNPVASTLQKPAKALYKISNLLQQVIKGQVDSTVDNNKLEQTRKELNNEYKNYVKNYGYITQKQDKKKQSIAQEIFKRDSSLYLLEGLETVTKTKDGVTKVEPSQILTKRTFTPYKPIDKVNNAQDGLIASLHDVGYVDLDYIEKLYGKSQEDIIKELGNQIYHNPNGSWETADEYLSGNVRKKLAKAQEMVNINPEYQRNIDALEKVIPEDISIVDISLQLGQPFIPINITQSAIAQILGISPWDIKLSYNSKDSTWSLKRGGKITITPEMKELAVKDLDAFEVVRRTLNMSTGKVMAKDDDGKKYLDKDATIELQNKMKRIHAQFKDIIMNNPEYAQKVQEEYNKVYNAIVPRDYTALGKILQLPNLNPKVKQKLYDHQLAGIARAVYGGNTLLAHCVGAGKTWTEIISIMEYRRLGLAKKPLLIVPNNKIGDYAQEFYDLYPSANVLILDDQDFTDKHLGKTLAQAAVNDWDCVIIRQSSLEKIPIGADIKRAFITKQIQEAEAVYADLDDNSVKTKQLLRQVDKLKEQLEEALSEENKSDVLSFDQIGFDMVVIDEAHFYKNLYVPGKAGQEKGMAVTATKKTADLCMKLDYIRAINKGNKGIIFGTGTPISNSMAETYIMMRYLNPDLLFNNGIKHFDEFARMFADIFADIEIKASGQFGEVVRFQGFKNLPELFRIFSEIADIKLSDDLQLPVPKLETGKPIVVKCEPAPEMSDIMQEVQDNWDEAAKNKTLFTYYNMMRSSAIDVRLVNDKYTDSPTSKINTAIKTVCDIYKQTNKDKGVQIIFLNKGRSDLETSKIDLYKEIVDKLVKNGIPKSQIALTANITNKTKLQQLYDKANTGKIRVLIGSMDKIGTGVNVQKRLFAIHELDVPFKPSQLEQAEGRILRVGNMYKTVRIYRYVTQGNNDTFSGDAYNWQLVEQKLRNINAVLKGDKAQRTISDEAEDMAMMKAIALGDPLYVEKIKLENIQKHMAIDRSSFLRNKLQASYSMEKDRNMLNKITHWITLYERYDKDLVSAKKPDSVSVTINKKVYNNRKDANKALKKVILQSQMKLHSPGNSKILGEYRGFSIVAVVEDGYIGPSIGYYIVNSSKYYQGQRYALSDTFSTLADYIKSIDNTIDNIPKQYTQMLNMAEQLKANIEKYAALQNAEFPEEQKYQDLMKKIADINKQLGIGEIKVDEETLNEDEDNNGKPTKRKKKAQAYSSNVITDSVNDLIKNNEQLNNTEPVSRTEIENMVRDMLDIPVGHGKFRQRALGIYKEHPEVIRLKKPKDLDVLFHELGHHLDHTLNLFNSEDDDKHGELFLLGKPVSKQSYTLLETIKEGFAEFIRLYITDEQMAQNAAPMFYSKFKMLILRHPEYNDIITILQIATSNYISQSPTERVLGNIDFGDGKKLKSTIGRNVSLKDLYTMVYDDIYPLKNAVNTITGGASIEISKDPYYQAWLHRGWQGKAETVLEYGVVNENFNKVYPSLNEILKPISNQMREFVAYATAKRAQELHERSIETGLRLEDINAVIEKHEGTIFDEVLDKLVEFQNKVLYQTLVKSGILSKDAYNAMKELNKAYVPFYRVMDNTMKGGNGKGFEAYQPVHKIKGSTRDILNPLASVIKNVYLFTNLASKNNIGVSLVELTEKYPGSGKIMDKVPPRMVPTTFSLRQIEKTLKESGVDTKSVDLNILATIFKQTGYTNKDKVITVYRNGTPEYYEVFDDALYQSFLALNYEQTNFVVKLLSYPTRLLRAGATMYNPDFSVRNPVRDTFQAAVNSEYGFIPVVDTMRGLAHVLGKTDEYYRLKAAGALNSTFVSMDKNSLNDKLRELEGKEGRKKFSTVIMTPLHLYLALSDALEEGTRVGAALKVMKKEGTGKNAIMKSSIEARDVTLDFLRFGVRSKIPNKLIAFFNSGMQGPEKVARVFKENPLGATLRAFLWVTLPSIALWLLNHEDKRYQELEDWQKDTFWIILGKKNVYRVPKPPLIGQIFGSSFERFLTNVYNDDPHALDGFGTRMKEELLPDVIPTALLPMIEVLSNYSFFKDSKIVPESETRLMPPDQYGNFTSETAKVIGKHLNVSPRKVDHLIQGYTGGLGKTITDTIDSVYNRATDKGVPYKTGADAIPGIRGFKVRQGTNQSTSILYNELQKAEKEYYSAKKNNPKTNLNNYPGGKQLRQLRKANEKIRKLRKELDSVYQTKMPAEQKRKEIDRINNQITDIARKAIGRD